jgi:hypothetical protein
MSFLHHPIRPRRSATGEDEGTIQVKPRTAPIFTCAFHTTDGCTHAVRPRTILYVCHVACYEHAMGYATNTLYQKKGVDTRCRALSALNGLGRSGSMS